MTETAETVIETVPVWVNPNFSKRIMGRASLVIFRVLTSARDGDGRSTAAMRRIRRGIRGVFVILESWGSGCLCVFVLDLGSQFV